uniref:Uncharacterized protein n=1 Tax=Klebsiella pneumoniae subsp. pneumoniae TaxID=72407 RepID=A0A1D9N9V6_KLEPN|nr:hypothetical protein A7K74_40 [Klebsiella pneumoniae subsp. pneumoniae]
MTVAKYHIESVQEWAPFTHNGQSYSLSHLNAHEITYKGKMQDFKFVVTYGMHCFTKDGTPYNIPLNIKMRESRSPFVLNGMKHQSNCNTFCPTFHR